MSKRKRESTSDMHPSNPYSNTRPDFVKLSELYPTLRPFVTVKGSGASARGVIDFHDPLALRELTYCLLKKDFSIELDIPLDSLCPAVPNRLNYICWIEDMMKSYSERDITGIDIGTGASCIYPLLGCTRNKNWRMVATDIDDRSILFASENVTRNRLQERITIVKNTTSLIFAEELFAGKEQRYDFCMCNPPFYEDEQDMRDSLDGKTDGPSAVCQGTSNEMMTLGGEVLFVQRMVDESTRWQTRIRWFTSMLGKRSSVDRITAYLKAKKATTKQISNKMVKLAPPKTVLSFVDTDFTPEAAEERTKHLLEGLMINHYPKKADDAEKGDVTRILHARASRNTWSRAARRALARQAKSRDESGTAQGQPLPDATSAPILEFDIRISAYYAKKQPDAEKEATSDTTEATPGTSIALAWTMGQDRVLFESLFLHFRDSFSRRQ
ncbi:hypothetical protein BGZ70_001127 [Mortierella alpina]|uniref:U6 small nuclear RNA (adenine-(43)-N(6))-methyltransferase n=1 Tax=Mortierella alpina TaxID=64518 RepID=A0A9P6IWN8_MORAP|nr:hypothetical protein BGZ70_001127 [Mortierella alpina]